MANRDFLSEIEKKFLENLNSRSNRMEIERKFLIKGFPGYLWEHEHYTIEQHYISLNPEVRVRKVNQDCLLTFKSGGGLERKETEIAIAGDQFEELKGFSQNRSIYKTRYLIKEDGRVYELDIYKNIEGLITVEIEFETKEDSDNFDIPKWFGDEITYIKEFKNKSLAEQGFPRIFICPHCIGKGSFEVKGEESEGCHICEATGKIGLGKIELAKYNQIVSKKMY